MEESDTGMACRCYGCDLSSTADIFGDFSCSEALYFFKKWKKIENVDANGRIIPVMEKQQRNSPSYDRKKREN
jgi:hypothetical protein